MGLPRRPRRKALRSKQPSVEGQCPSKAIRPTRQNVEALPMGPSARKKVTEGMSAKEKQKPAKGKAANETTIDADVLAEASKLGLDGMLRNLAARPEVIACGKSSREIFSTLQASGGLVNAAKRALVSGLAL